MRALGFIPRLVNWRWTPAVGLVVGSMLFVLLAVVLIPDEFVPSSIGSTDAARLARGQGLSRFRAAGADRSGTGDDSSPFVAKAPDPDPGRVAGRDVVQSIFHPVAPMELPVAPADPGPPPPPPPTPTATFFALEAPPPSPPNPAAVEPAPEAPPADPAAIPEAPVPNAEAEVAAPPIEAPAATGEVPPGAPAPP